MRLTQAFFIITIGLLFGSCASIEKSALRSLGNMLAGEGGASVFTGDDDPQLIADSIPFALKIYEILLDKDPENRELRAATGKTFVMYSAAFVQMPAERLAVERWREAAAAQERAQRLFRRGRDYLLESLNQKYENFTSFFNEGRYDEALALLQEEDMETAYWTVLAWFGMASTDPLNIEMTEELDKPAAMLYRLLDLSEDHAGVHGTLVQLLASLPPSLLILVEERSLYVKTFVEDYYQTAGIGEDLRLRILHHYDRALVLSEGTDPSLHLALAMGVAVKDQNPQQFIDLIDTALAISPEENPDSKLLIIIYQDRARWLRENMENYFLVDFEDLL